MRTADAEGVVFTGCSLVSKAQPYDVSLKGIMVKMLADG